MRHDLFTTSILWNLSALLLCVCARWTSHARTRVCSRTVGVHCACFAHIAIQGIYKRSSRANCKIPRYCDDKFAFNVGFLKWWYCSTKKIRTASTWWCLTSLSCCVRSRRTICATVGVGTRTVLVDGAHLTGVITIGIQKGSAGTNCKINEQSFSFSGNVDQLSLVTKYFRTYIHQIYNSDKYQTEIKLNRFQSKIIN